MSKNRSREEILEALNISQANGHFTIIGNLYTRRNDKTICKCNKCGREWETNFGAILSGCSCIVCKRKESHEKQRKEKEQIFLNRVEKLNLDYVFDGFYENENSKYNCTCKICGKNFIRTARLIMQGCECPQCRFNRVGKERRKTHEEFLHDLSKLTDEILIKSKYKTNHDKVICKCKYCGYEWNAKPNVLLSGTSLNCKMCSLAYSVPNRFMLNCLAALGIDYEQEKIFDWSDNKRYDFYIPSLNIIIEMHGGQHYAEGFSSLTNAKSLQEIQTNDSYKMKLALSNGIKNYIVIDSRESTKKWLINNLLHSEIGYLFNNIDFDEVFKKCYISSTARFAELYNSGVINIQDLMTELSVKRNSVYRLKRKAIDAKLIAS